MGNSEDTTAGAIETSQVQPRVLLENAADAYFEVDLQGKLVGVNSALLHMLECPSSDSLVGHPVSDLLGENQWERLRGIGRQVLDTGEPVAAIEIVFGCPRGQVYTLEISMNLLHQDNAPAGFWGIVHDVSGRATAVSDQSGRITQLEMELSDSRQLYNQVSELEQLKTQMIRIAAHDLRSPLSIVTSYVELLVEDLAPHFNDLDEMYVGAIRQAVARMLQMTTDILSLERLRETQDATLTEVQLGRLLDSAIIDLSGETMQFQQVVNTEIEPLRVFGDAMELREAIVNLLSNAIKYTPKGGTITASLRRDGDEAVLSIEDTGYGIPEDQQNELFRPFTRIKTRETYSIDGTGLGLYLVKRIVERHDGKVFFHSEHGKGSVFGFRLPIASLKRR